MLSAVEHYVTLIDSLFLPQALALHASMCRHAGAFTLWILCVDDAAHEVLGRLAPAHVRLLRLAELETPELLGVKGGRTRAEYCWTLTPFAPRFVFEADPAVMRVTYLDADLWFLRHPAPLFEELEAARRSVLITEHAYAPEYDRSAESGRFCVQFVCFTRGRSELVRAWWEARCIEWCFARFEGGRFGDQKYLDDWPERFADEVHVLQGRGLAQAPWNARCFAPAQAVFFHFHSLRIMRGGWVLLAGGYQLPDAVRGQVYARYLGELSAAIAGLRAVGWEAGVQDRRRVWQRALQNLGLALRQGSRAPWTQLKVARLPAHAPANAYRAL